MEGTLLVGTSLLVELASRSTTDEGPRAVWEVVEWLEGAKEEARTGWPALSALKMAVQMLVEEEEEVS